MTTITHIKGNVYRCTEIDGRVRHIRNLTRMLFNRGIRHAEMVKNGQTVLIAIDGFGWMAQPWCPIQ